MKSINKISGIFLALLATAIFYSCNEEVEYTPAEKLNSDQVYFPSSNKASINLSSLEQSFRITIARVKTDNAVTVPLTATGGGEFYNIPASVAFAQGESTGLITIGYDPAVVGFDNFTEIKLSIGGEGYTSPYGLTEYTVKVGIPAPWVSLGKCTFIEDFLTTFYGVDNIPYQVEIQENQLQPGFFRLVNAFGADYPYNDPGDWDTSKDWYLEIHAEDPTAVYMNVQETGMIWSYGMFSVGSLAGYYMERGQTLEEVKAAGYTGTYENGVITFPAATMLIKMANYQNGGLYKANNNGAFKVAMPGVVLADYSLAIAYAGKYTDAKDKIAGVLAQILEAGKDVESIRLAVVEGTDVDVAVEEIKSGNIPFVEVAAKAATVQLPFAAEPVAGKYTIVAVAYDNDKAQTVASAEFKYAPPAAAETWTAHSTGDYEYSLFFTDDNDGPVTDVGLTLYQSNSDPNRYKIEHWGYDVDFIFTYNEATGEVMVADQEVGYVHPSYGTVMVDDLVDFYGGTNYGQSYYEDGVFHFAVLYYVSAGIFGRGYETFTLTGSSLAAAKVKMSPSIHTENKKAQKASIVLHKELVRNTAGNLLK
ncbi:MAG: hypothetical protein LBH19_09435 [Dysgonamonadaceae bacterium]|jgi:hypothetical protein|nr:hypothetical protein [Dysgonamonadaceae bacterium]